MTGAPEGESVFQDKKIERITNLLSHDFAQLPTPQQPTEPPSSPEGQIPFRFAAPLGEESVASHPRMVGFDEAGRGALAGPVTVACVSFALGGICLPSGNARDDVLETYADLNDSKKVTARVRERLLARIVQDADWGIGFASAMEIDQIGIVPACQAAARRAYRKLGIHAERALFDRGLSLGEEETRSAFSSAVQITKGDAKSFHIAAASILAKVRRDAILCHLDTRASVYGFASHKGYGSAAHISAIQQHGPSRFHRKTFLTRIC